jgi:DNA mismatch repair protein MutS
MEPHHVRVQEWKGDVVFLHEVSKGSADRSYGIQVARLAGLPTGVISRAREVLELLESTDNANAAEELADALPLFSTHMQQIQVVASGPSASDEALDDINPDDLTPREALEQLYLLKQLRQDDE